MKINPLPKRNDSSILRHLPHRHGYSVSSAPIATSIKSITLPILNYHAFIFIMHAIYPHGSIIIYQLEELCCPLFAAPNCIFPMQVQLLWVSMVLVRSQLPADFPCQHSAANACCTLWRSLMHHSPASATRGRYTAVTKLFIVQFCCCPSWRLSTARPNVQHGAGATNGIFNPIR